MLVVAVLVVVAVGVTMVVVLMLLMVGAVVVRGRSFTTSAILRGGCGATQL